ncbi:DNA alkylation repair protein [Cohnella faecalis]|uniref:DNA alkylation repair protein n=1 Tax=Cohnella faecalis TaxID=2315694 RepID=A0A398CKD3_9BACL|nr:DNA alkylation repair protein [Cohnella faecalis]
MEETIKALQMEFERHRDPSAAEAMEGYMRGQFPFFGIKAPLRRELMKAFLAEHSPSKELIWLLWNLPEREYAALAVDLLFKIRKQLEPADIALVERCIVTKSWWDTVDGIASSVVGYLFDRFPELRDEYAERWIRSDNFWLNRTAILFQLRYKEKTDERRLYDYVRRHAGSSEFFLQKAIGWALREYAKTSPASVVRFVGAHEWKPLSRREALKNIDESALAEQAEQETSR